MRAAAIMILEGTQPTFTQVPPISPRSMTLTSAPASAARSAAAVAAPPLPMMAMRRFRRAESSAGPACALSGGETSPRPAALHAPPSAAAEGAQQAAAGVWPPASFSPRARGAAP